MDQYELLNRIYQPLENKRLALHRRLARQGHPVTSAYFNGHYRRGNTGYRMDVFPIPEVTVTGLCDIEIGPEEICVSTKLTRDAALSYDYGRLSAYTFEVFGVEDYLNDLYLPSDSSDTLRSRIQECPETEIGFSFRFSMGAEDLPEFVTFLKSEGFYY